MDKKIQFPESYRYDSDMRQFKMAVNCAKDMLETGKMIILYQFIDTISAKIFISRNEFEQKYEGIDWNDFIEILNEEIIYLLRRSFEGSMEKDPTLKRYLEEKNVPEEWHEEIIKFTLDKCNYVKESLGEEREKNRYSLKNRSFLKKLSNIDFELSRTIDEKEVLYATINMSVNSTLEGRNTPRQATRISNQENITFICDKSDIEYLIRRLERIKQML